MAADSSAVRRSVWSDISPSTSSYPQTAVQDNWAAGTTPISTYPSAESVVLHNRAAVDI